MIQGKIRRKKQKKDGGVSQTTHRLAKFAAREARASKKAALVTVATYNGRTLAVKGRNGYEHAECVLVKSRQLGCEMVGLQETRRPG